MKQQKIALAIFSLIAIFSLAVSPALADKGINIITDVNGTENFFYGRSSGTMEAGTSYLLFENSSFVDMFRIDGDGTVYGQEIRGQEICDENGANCHDISDGWSGLGGTDGYIGDSGTHIAGGNLEMAGQSIRNADNLGIGFDGSPQFKLDIRNGHIGVSDSTDVKLMLAGRRSSFPTSGSNNGAIVTTASGGSYPFNEYGNLVLTSRMDQAQDVVIMNGAPPQVRAVFNRNGSVGIGTTAPSSKLHVGGGSIRVDNDQSIFFQNASASAVLGIKADSSDRLTFRTGGAWDRMVIEDNGNVGIDTNNPSTKLQVWGGQTVNRISQGGSSDTPYTELTQRSWGGNAGILFSAYGADSYVNGGLTTTGNTKYKFNASVFGTSDHRAKAIIAGHDNLTFYVSDASTGANQNATWNNKLSINKDNVYVSGSFGVGTGSPSKTLHVNDGALVGDTYQVPQGSIFTNASQAQMILGGSFNAGYNSGSNKAKLLITSYDNDDATDIFPIYVEDENGFTDFYLKNRQDQSARPTAFFGGNIGIGNDLPGAPLHIVNNSDDYGIIIDNGHLTIRDALEGTTNTNLNDDGGSSYINAIGGNVGIGTSGPNATLDVNGGVWLGGSGGKLATFGERASDNGNYEYVEFQSGASSRAGIILWDGDWSGCDSGKFCIFGDTHQLMLKSNTGNVIIDDGLAINGSVTANGSVWTQSLSSPSLSATSITATTITVNGSMTANQGVKLGNNSGSCNSGIAGTLRYGSGAGESYLQACMQISSSGYAWRNILTYNW